MYISIYCYGVMGFNPCPASDSSPLSKAEPKPAIQEVLPQQMRQELQK
jgi:hypothetical protein